MVELIVFCNPQRAYRGKTEQDVGKAYKKMAIEDYDRLVSFDESYKPFVETPDYETVVGQKGGRDLRVTMFAQQPMTRVREIRRRFLSSSYLFNPESTEGLLLPDLDIVQIAGPSQVRDAANAIKQFYEGFGWLTYVFDGKITGGRKKVNPTSSRFSQPIEILDPDTLKEIARERVGYNHTDLCF